jgi:hypothetical protein
LPRCRVGLDHPDILKSGYALPRNLD